MILEGFSNSMVPSSKQQGGRASPWAASRWIRPAKRGSPRSRAAAAPPGGGHSAAEEPGARQRRPPAPGRSLPLRRRRPGREGRDGAGRREGASPPRRGLRARSARPAGRSHPLRSPPLPAPPGPRRAEAGGGSPSRLRRLQGRLVPLAAPHGAMQLQWEGEETHPPRPAAAFVTAQPGPTRSGSASAGARRREQMEPEGKAATPGRAGPGPRGAAPCGLRAAPAESSAGLGLPGPAGNFFLSPSASPFLPPPPPVPGSQPFSAGRDPGGRPPAPARAPAAFWGAPGAGGRAPSPVPG